MLHHHRTRQQEEARDGKETDQYCLFELKGDVPYLGRLSNLDSWLAKGLLLY